MTPFIYLASQSPRRSDLLKQIGINFQLLLLRDDPRKIPEVDETPQPNEAASVYVKRVCLAKTDAAWASLQSRNLPLAPVLSADTAVALDNAIIGKPRDKDDAANILRLLSGRQHQVYTAVAVRLEQRTELRMSKTDVTFARLDEARIRRYLAGEESNDKAGAYGIQGVAAAFVQRLEGSYSGVVGLPLYETAELLQSFGYPAP
jgi:septum formation protein